ncbi:hypothetical protein [uncultured Duncaniella sp.]|nr:hypothetical protein [uncultured Duncaniella sp.]
MLQRVAEQLLDILTPDAFKVCKTGNNDLGGCYLFLAPAIDGLA